MKVGVIGAGSWGSALSIYFSNLGYDVLLWVYEEELYNYLIQERENKFFLKGYKFKSNVGFTRDFEEFERVNLIFLAVPVQHLRSVLKNLRKNLKAKHNFVNCSKGIEIETLKIPSEIILDELNGKVKEIGTLSGPTFAKEVVRGLPTAAVFSSKNKEFSIFLQEKFSSKSFRFYRSNDLIGVELAGALKNIYAIGSGIIKGLNLGTNAWAAFLTRVLHEMKRFCLFFGGKAKTLSGLSGFGDLILTASSQLSRNFTVGFRIGKGEKIKSIIECMNMVAEGVHTLKAVYQISKKNEIEMPIAEILYKILYEDLNIKLAIEELMLRELKEESKI